MIPPTFQIGDEVLIIGPTITGCKLHTGERFTIEQVDHNKYSGHGLPYYPASSLRLVNEKPLSPMQVTYNYKPDDCEHGTIQVSCPCGRKAEIDPNWPKLDEELKIGDFAEVILEGNPFTGKIGQVSSIGELTVALYDIGIWSRGNLRKLTPEEIKRHTNPGKQYPITPAKDFDELTLRDVARMAGICKNEYGVWISTLLKRAHETEDRLSAIEKRQEEARKYSDDLYSITETLAERIYALQKRVEFVEKFQREQAEAAQYRRNMLWMAGP